MRNSPDQPPAPKGILPGFHFVLLTVLWLLPQTSLGQLDWVLETGAVWQNRNDVRIAPDTGSYVEFDEFNPGPFLHFRTEAIYHFNKRHGLRLLYAPFSVQVSGIRSENTLFDGQTFAPGNPLTVNYQFNSYRLSYRYGLVLTNNHQFYVGFTGKIREAKIRFSQGANSQEYTNLGFVPLIYLFYEGKLSDRWSFVADLDAAAASQGRAIDLAVKVRRKVFEQGAFGLGYRTLEGGADNEKVFTFSWFNYALLDFVYSF